jgi:superfamily II DNA/RNA helicase
MPWHKKGLLLLQQGFFFTAEADQISNQEFYEDISKIMKLIESEIPG